MNRQVVIILSVVVVLVGLLLFANSRTEHSHPTELTTAELQEALLEYNPNLADYQYQVVIEGTHDAFARFRVEPDPGVELDAAFGFAQFAGGSWKIIHFGTGGDPTEFYKQYNIPKELRIPGY